MKNHTENGRKGRLSTGSQGVPEITAPSAHSADIRSAHPHSPPGLHMMTKCHHSNWRAVWNQRLTGTCHPARPIMRPHNPPPTKHKASFIPFPYSPRSNSLGYK